MNPKKHPLTTVTDLLNAIRPVTSGMWCLHVTNHQLQICRCDQVHKDCPIIARITALDVNTGLTVGLWNRIDGSIRTLRKKGVIEWQAPKP